LLGTTRFSRAILAYHPGIAFPPQVRWPGRFARPFAMRCPNCQDTAPKPRVVAVTWKPVEEPADTILVLRCPACTACFFDDQKPPDYTEPSLLERGRVPFYLQQGAGLSLITRPLACIERPSGARYLEVGCGFGFGIDFAANAKGWIASGIDPAPLSALGRDMLGVDIALRYLSGEDAAAHECDVVMSSETVEHVRSPRDFVRVLRWALKPGGVLVLTTPDADAVRPQTPEGALIPLLSPGLHLTLQSERSLRALLRDAGFRHIEIEHDAYSLLAFASDAELTLTRDPRRVRAAYRDYLEGRAGAMPTDGDLFLGFAARGLLEAINDSEDVQAGRIFARLHAVCAERFGIDLDAPVIPNAAWTASLEELARLVPLNLAVLMYSRAMMSLRSGDSGRAERCLSVCTQAAAIMRRALADIAIADGLTEDIGWAATAELGLCAAGGARRRRRGCSGS
jgi:SAM-dependent methyltransferase